MQDNPIYYHLTRRRSGARNAFAWGGALMALLFSQWGTAASVAAVICWTCSVSAFWNASHVAALWKQACEDLRLSRMTPTEAVDAGLVRTLAQTVPLVFLCAFFVPWALLAIPIVFVAYPNLLMLRLGSWPWWLPTGCAGFMLALSLVHFEPQRIWLMAGLPVWLTCTSRLAAIGALARVGEPDQVGVRALTTNPWACALVTTRSSFGRSFGNRGVAGEPACNS